MKLVHWSSIKEFEIENIKYKQQIRRKPDGIWLSNENSKNSWSKFTSLSDEIRRAKCYKYYSEFKIRKNAKICIITNNEQIKEFTAKYGVNVESELICEIDWRKVSEDYDGIYVEPHNIVGYYEGGWPNPKIYWLHCWDVDSACIWNLNVLEKVKK